MYRKCAEIFSGVKKQKLRSYRCAPCFQRNKTIVLINNYFYNIHIDLLCLVWGGGNYFRHFALVPILSWLEYEEELLLPKGFAKDPEVLFFPSGIVEVLFGFSSVGELT